MKYNYKRNKTKRWPCQIDPSQRLPARQEGIMLTGGFTDPDDIRGYRRSIVWPRIWKVTLTVIAGVVLGTLAIVATLEFIPRYRDPLYRAVGIWSSPLRVLQEKELCFSHEDDPMVCVAMTEEISRQGKDSITFYPQRPVPIWDKRYVVELVGFTTFMGEHWFFKLRCVDPPCDNRAIDKYVGENVIPVDYRRARDKPVPERP